MSGKVREARTVSAASARLIRYAVAMSRGLSPIHLYAVSVTDAYARADRWARREYGQSTTIRALGATEEIA